ncbi:MAG TPA: alpha-ketoglutarate-dependent dioxygenase AlkB [Gordonia sp. (in: high G+C Gram-positive bacteria)]|uniref:alpha-ketoglutarate-dependent dioxygenase AlkB n=1 Tax=unclassified Gordonia (in: high G+C Gram-positive bacteria) TaxID=2657482 RepID=UPI000FB4AFD5|nr:MULTISPECIES: alpha-ketoglutarate-dependent dioxygenase AlkB [unclassified Gordonia (in: high G+C Gram-positive bacteria)]RUP36988.1 MAG: alpha-ketoglutarate-dependent dioxygenase AlkB [Gordonia sp. (in: high G+C Gram-positive bacteria)]HNP55841.1 alpha-ketoglutarate-dependent dioxygenase AlkB [Gordonia sp. (in: high G+C Gram-positive bacteria)]HRC50936.1 alpha-ketoglutarate-dependent dioxygenase AlkB [Gordonia sp. (in: high G+C Gram-positive bacteria)]
MSTAFQDTLFGAADTAPALQPLSSATRTHLDHGAWVDLRPGWLTGSAGLFDALLDGVAWRREQRQMYDRVVDVPRLVAHFTENDRLPEPLLVRMRDELSEHYRDELPGGFATAGLCCYRDGSDSVAWHGDRFGRGAHTDTLVAIVSLGSPRTLHLRPRGGGTSLRFPLGSGDLLVMGGSCQRTWDHAVPKEKAGAPRISIQFRPTGVW